MLNLIKTINNNLKEYIRFQKYKQYLPENPMHDDIYIVEFPKSGITWLQYIIGNIELQLLGIKNECITFYNHNKYLPDIHQLRGGNINRLLNRTFIKSHSEYNPYYYFVIYLIRNPFDVMVSYYNFSLHSGEKYESFEKFIKSLKGIKIWKRHVLSWWYRRIDAQRIHFIKYEELLKDPVHEISELYKNLGVSVEKEIIEEAVERSKLQKMRASEEHYRKYNPNYSMSFVGKHGKIKKEELLTDEVREYILQETKEIIKFFYPELLKNGGTS